MTVYQAPVRDLQFLLHDVFRISESGLPGHDELDRDFTAAVLEAAGQLAAEVLALSEERGETKASRKRAVKQATQEVASYLGNTPTIARNSYIDPRIIDAYESGSTLGDAARKRYRTPEARQRGLEQAVLELLAE